MVLKLRGNTSNKKGANTKGIGNYFFRKLKTSSEPALGFMEFEQFSSFSILKYCLKRLTYSALLPPNGGPSKGKWSANKSPASLPLLYNKSAVFLT